MPKSFFPELTAPVDLCANGGRLNPAALGYARTPLIRPNLPGGIGQWGRNKRWEYWGIVTKDHILGVTIASLDYVGLLQLYLWDRRQGRKVLINEEELRPLARGIGLPDVVPPFEAFGKGKIALNFSVGPDSDRLNLRSSRVQFDVKSKRLGDLLAVVIPWSDRRFQYTVKDVARPVSGRLVVDEEVFELKQETSFSVLDRGRGRWPYRMTWN